MTQGEIGENEMVNMEDWRTAQVHTSPRAISTPSVGNLPGFDCFFKFTYKWMISQKIKNFLGEIFEKNDFLVFFWPKNTVQVRINIILHNHKVSHGCLLLYIYAIPFFDRRSLLIGSCWLQ